MKTLRKLKSLVQIEDIILRVYTRNQCYMTIKTVILSNQNVTIHKHLLLIPQSLLVFSRPESVIFYGQGSFVTLASLWEADWTYMEAI